ncbi:MAG: Crp/Fnr family transcriptional regulator, partial [Deltaproteobacteria bacterium]
YDEHPCWQVAARKIAEEHYVKKNRREFEFMQLSADSRYEAFLEAHADLLPRLSQYHIAAYLGITPVALSRIRRRRRMRRKGSG